jgi:hypothetical protein
MMRSPHLWPLRALKLCIINNMQAQQQKTTSS